jgi:hypothetical protein
MNRAMVDKLARVVLYEGYMLYPYRPSVKNSQRWTFGGVYPRAWSEAQTGTDLWSMHTECLIRGSEQSKVHVIVRFLQLMDRKVGQLETPLDEMPRGDLPIYRQVPFLKVGDQTYQCWQEAEEREIDLGELRLTDQLSQCHRKSFEYFDRQTTEPLRSDSGIIAILIRKQKGLKGVVEVSASPVCGAIFKLTVRIVNQTQLAEGGTRDEALMRSLISTHTVLGVGEGEFVSLTDPPTELKSQAAACRNIGTWPVLVGDAPQSDTMLSSPIILPDYPLLAPESPGDLFDGTEIDEILTLRILTLTDEEKEAAAGVDHRVRDLLKRTEALARDQLMNLHGAMRTVPQEQHNG